jgi:hypothetical protein
MADFYPILARAVAGLTDPSPEARRAIYERARTALVTQLRSLDPPLGEAEIMRERLSLDEAMARIEAEHGDAAPAPPPLPEMPPAPPAANPEPVREALRPAMPAPVPAEPAAIAAPAALDEPPADAPEAQPIRPRIAPPREKRVAASHVRTMIVGGGVALAVAAIAATAIYIHKINPIDPEPRPRIATPVQPGQPDNAGKLGDRVGEAGNPNAPRPGSGTPTQTLNGEVAVAQRAILYTEDPANPQQPRAIQGRVFWRLDSESAGQGRPVETIVRATIEIAEAGLALDFTVRRNTDTAFPASHIIGLRFTPAGDPAQNAVREVGVPQFKIEEGERGAPLSAINSALGDNLFVAALSNVPVEVERNLELILNRLWIDVPVRFASGRRGIITFEKGVSGSQTLADAFGRWR